MAFEQKDNSGALFKNKRKETDTQPDYNGTAMIGGVEYYMNAWLKESKAGEKYFSFSFKQKNEAGRSAVAAAREILQPGKQEALPEFDDNDSIPF